MRRQAYVGPVWVDRGACIGLILECQYGLCMRNYECCSSAMGCYGASEPGGCEAQEAHLSRHRPEQLGRRPPTDKRVPQEGQALNLARNEHRIYLRDLILSYLVWASLGCPKDPKV